MVSSEILRQSNELRQNRKGYLNHIERGGWKTGEWVSKAQEGARKEANQDVKQIHQCLGMRSELISQKEIRKANKVERNEEKLYTMAKHVPSIG